MKQKRKVIIVGAGGFGREIYEYILDAGVWQVIGFLDDNPAALAEFDFVDAPIIGPIGGSDVPDDVGYVLGVGNPKTRRTIVEILDENSFETIVHPTAYVSCSATISRGCVVGPFAFVGSNAQLAEHVMVNTRSTIGHDAVVGRYSELSPHSAVGGASVLGEGIFLGTGAIVNPTKSVGDWTKVSSGTTVSQDAEVGSLVATAPARSRQMFKVEAVSKKPR